MKTKLIMVMLGMAALMSACGSEGLDTTVSGGPQGSPAGECSNPDECAVIADILKNMEGDSINVQAQLKALEFITSKESLVNGLGVSEELAGDFVEKNTSAQDIAISEKSLNLSNVNFVLDSDQLTPPTSMIRFSRVGLNHAKDQALVEASGYCVTEFPTFCGGGNYRLYQKVDGHWVLVKQTMSWIS